MRAFGRIAERMREIVGHGTARQPRCRGRAWVFAGENPSV